MRVDFIYAFQFPFPGTKQQDKEMLQQALAIQHLMLQQQQMQQQLLHQQFKDKQQAARESAIPGLHPVLQAAVQQLPNGMPQTPTSVSTNTKARFYTIWIA